MAAGDEANLLIGCRMMTSDKKLIRYDDDSSYMDEFRAGAGLFFQTHAEEVARVSLGL